MSDDNTVHQYNKMTLQPRRKHKKDITGGKTLASTEAKQQGLPALETVNYETYRVGSEKAVLPVVLASDKKAAHQYNKMNS